MFAGWHPEFRPAVDGAVPAGLCACRFDYPVRPGHGQLPGTNGLRWTAVSEASSKPRGGGGKTGDLGAMPIERLRGIDLLRGVPEELLRSLAEAFT